MRSALLACLFLLAGCNDKTTLRLVPVEGLPACAAPGELLRRPVVLEIEHAGGKLTQTFLGTGAAQVSLAERKDDLRVRVGVCEPTPPARGGAARVVTCASPSWLGDPQKATVDPREPGAKLVVKVPGEHPCAP